MKKILLTGSSGFLGSHYKKFLESYYTVICADRSSGIDLTDKNKVDQLPDVDIVVHFAAFNGTKKFYTQPYDVVRDNLLPTQYLLDRYSGKVEMFIHAGTCESYAGGLALGLIDIPTPEDIPLVVDDIMNPRWSYGGSKIANELQVIAAHHQHNQNFQIIRFHNVYGPGQVDHFIPEFVSRINNGDATVFGANETRSFCYVSDALEACHQLMNTPAAYNKIINVGTGKESTILEIAEIISKELKIDLPLIPVEGKKGSVARRCPDISLLKSLIDWEPKIDLVRGLKLTLESIK
jgi:nucleoside-diphosphate-sugar epimerase